MDALLEDVDIDALVERIDFDQLLDGIDLDRVLARIDLDAVLERIDLNEALDRVDANRLLDGVDANRLLDRIDVNALLDRVDPDRLLDRVDPDRLLDRVNPDELLARVDPNELIARTDLNAALDKVDIDKVMDRVDVEKVIDRAGIPEIVRESTGHMAESMLDTVRRQLVAVDQVIMRVTLKLTLRGGGQIPAGPPALMRTGSTDGEFSGQVTGHYAGPVSRLVGFIIDVFAVFGGFTLFSAGIIFVFSDLLGQTGFAFSTGALLGLLLFTTWAFFYGSISLAVAGRTFGMGVVGLRVVSKEGLPLHLGQAVVRVLSMPLSFFFFGLGFIGLLIGKRRRALHDVIAGAVVVYDWGDRPAEMSAPLTRWLVKREDQDVSSYISTEPGLTEKTRHS